MVRVFLSVIFLPSSHPIFIDIVSKNVKALEENTCLFKIYIFNAQRIM